MSYTKNIAVINGVKEGFSADGGALTGLVKAEKYYNNLKIEVSLLNFAPLTEGRYVCALSDGEHVQLVEDCHFEGQSAVDTSAGFAAAVFYVHGGVKTVATAVCGAFAYALPGLKAEVEKIEKITQKPNTFPQKQQSGGKNYSPPPGGYADEALAEDNYYEYDDRHKDTEVAKDGAAVRAAEKEEEAGAETCLDETPSRAEKQQTGIKNGQNGGEKSHGGTDSANGEDDGGVCGGLARGNFYARLKGEIDGLFAAYPPCAELNAAIEGSRWVKIFYGEKFYVFGEICKDGAPAYLCYGVPGDKNSAPPGLSGVSQFLPVPCSGQAEGVWVLFQDALTGCEIAPAGRI